MGKKNLFIFSIALIIVFLDQITKFLVRQNFKLNESIPVIKNALHLTYVTNTGSAFGLFKGINLFFILLSIFVVIMIFHYLRKIAESEKLLQFSVGLLLGGAIGNLIDRILYGAVTDFLDFRIWPVFNVADSAVTIGIILLMVLLWKK